MKTKDTMTKRFSYAYNELDSLAKFLEKQAEAGWELTSKTGVMLGFRRAEPRKVKISVQLVYADRGDREKMQYIELCEAAGWKHIFSDGKIQIFEHEDLDAPSIDTEPELKLAAIHKKSLRDSVIIPGICLLILPVLIWAMFKDWGVYAPPSYSEIWSHVMILILPVIIMISIADYFIWYRKAKRTAAAGIHPKYTWRLGNHIALEGCLFIIFGNFAMNLLDAAQLGGKGIFIAAFAFLVVAGMLTLFPFVSARTTKDRTGNIGMFVVMTILAGIAIFIAGQMITQIYF